MNYDEAKNYLYNGDGSVEKELGHKFNALFMAVTDDDVVEGLNLIQELTSCDDNTAKLLWVDLKRDFGTKENNPILQAREEYEKEEAIRKKEEMLQAIKYKNNAECPYCHSKNTKKISTLSKAGSVALFGVFAIGKTSKQWHCKNCGSDF